MANEEKPADSENDYGTKWAGLRGWPLLEQFMTDLDTGMVNGYNEDINTYLTFAGLFSAVLTGLLVISFALLQPDGTDKMSQKLDRMTLILDRISLQLFNSSTPPTEPSPEAAMNFDPLTSSLWINSLWFSSLVLSLAAALFAVVAKQWLREYLSWTTMSGPSEQQVFLRQVRYEAFIRWKVATVIAFIPVLLETSLIMFLIGLAILLQTLNDRVVFRLCTAEVALLVILALAVTVLPVIFPQCAYKSPAGWALLRGWQAAMVLFQQLTNVIGPLLKQTGWESDNGSSRWKDWRQRELADRRWIAASATIPEPRIFNAFEFLGNLQTSNTIAQMLTLSSSLEWVLDTSQDTRIMRAIEECTPTYPDDWAPFSRLVVDLHIACTALDIDLHRLVPPEGACICVRQGDPVVKSSEWSFFSTSFLVLRRVNGNETWQSVVKEIAAPPSMLIHMAHSIARSLSAVINDTEESHWTMERYGRQGDYYLQAASVLAFFLVNVAVHRGRGTSAQLSTVIADCAALFEKVASEAFAKAPYASRFFSVCIPLYQGIWVFEDTLGRCLLLASEEAPRHTRYALSFCRAPLAEWCKNECRIFNFIAMRALSEWATRDETIVNLRGTLLPPLFVRMRACAERCLQLEEWSCLENWPIRLHILTGASSSDYTLSPDLFLHDLVAALKRCNDIAPLEVRWASLEDLVERSRELRPTPERPMSSSDAAAAPRPSSPSSSVSPDVSTSVQLDTSSFLNPVPESPEARLIAPAPSGATLTGNIQRPPTIPETVVTSNDGQPYRIDQVLIGSSALLTAADTTTPTHTGPSTTQPSDIINSAETAEVIHLVEMPSRVHSDVHGSNEDVMVPLPPDEDVDGGHSGPFNGSL